MRRVLWMPLCLLPLLLTGCPPTIRMVDPTSLAEVDFHHININLGIDYRLHISSTGALAFQLQAAGAPNQRATGQLTAAEMTALFNAFKGWGQLDPHYPGDWTNTILVTYNGCTVEVHDELQAPKQFLVIQDMLRTYLREAMPAATRAAESQPATTTAPATAPQP
jgi:hypothetical protein